MSDLHKLLFRSLQRCADPSVLISMLKTDPCSACAATLLLAALLLLGCRLGAAVEHANGPNAAAIAQGEQKNTQDADAAGAQPASSAATSGRLAAAAIAASHLQQDDSVRCRLSGICEGPEPDCSEDGSSSSRPSEAGQPDPLACLTADADRAAAVQAAARHAWSGYRCAFAG